MKLLIIAFFGVLGVLSRYYAGTLVTKFFDSSFPLGTFIINFTGAFLIGVIYVLGIERAVISNELRLGLMVGFLGGYTTFSSYCIEAARLIEESEYFYAALYFGVSPVLGLLASFGGMMLTRAFMGYLK